jgi:hypothetical protein
MASAIARQALDKARFFTEQATASGAVGRPEYQQFLEAAIIFARTVTFHIQKEFGSHPSFPAWYDQWRKRLASDPRASFFLEARNYALKQGPLLLRHHLTLTVSDGAQLFAEAGLAVVRMSPWYRLTLRQLIQQWLIPLRVRLHNWRERRRIRALRLQAKSQRSGEATLSWRFDHPQWGDRPATALLEEHLVVLEGLVAEAEGRFLGSRPNGAAAT